MNFNELPYYFSTKFDEDPTKSGFLCAFGVRNPRFRAFRAQNKGFCALLGSGTPVFGRFEHKIGVFVLFLPSEPSFSGVPSTKSGFLCAFGVWNPRYRAFRAQNRHVCALFDFGTPIFRLFEHKSCFHGNQSLMGDGKINRG